MTFWTWSSLRKPSARPRARTPNSKKSRFPPCMAWSGRASWPKKSAWPRTWPCGPSMKARSDCASWRISSCTAVPDAFSKKAPRQRLDVLVVERGLVESREKARALILAGQVLVNGQKADKAGANVDTGAKIDLLAQPRYVGRGGLKLEAALDHFGIAVAGKICLDIGSSTGGFTDCLLQREAARVYAIDAGTGQLDWKLRNDPRVVVR